MTPLSTDRPSARSVGEIFASLETSEKGLREAEARKRLVTRNGITAHRVKWWTILFRQFTNSLVLILIGASFISFALGEGTSTAILVTIVVASGLLSFVQEFRSEHAVALLKKKLTRYATVIRDGSAKRINADELVPGDLVELELGNVVPADLRLIAVDDLEIDESALTGESMPVPKTDRTLDTRTHTPQERTNMAFMGTNVVQGSARGIVVATGNATEFGQTAAAATQAPQETEFQKGVRTFGAFLLKVTLGLSAFVFVILFLIRGEWSDSLLFALAIAVGISPELLPLIVTITLSRGALAMSKKKVLVKQLIAIEDLGNADVFCTDKTGTLTVGTLRVRESIGPDGRRSPLPLAYAARCLDRGMNGRARNPVDLAIQEAADSENGSETPEETISFDFLRRRMSCIWKTDHGHELITKGAASEVLACSKTYLTPEGSRLLTPVEEKRLRMLTDAYGDRGTRLMAVARRSIAAKTHYVAEDERDLELIGFVAVSDAPKASARPALESLEKLGVRVMILTGDDDRVMRHVARELDFGLTGILTGSDIDAMHDADLAEAVERTNVFARITPVHKLRIITALKANGRTVGFMGDGVNDAPALHAADVGISFDHATDVAKDAADIILLQKNLGTLVDGIREGRRTFVNIRTYLYATISSNFGNMLSVAGAALLLPFLPMLPAQILLLNLLSDIPMLAIPSDRTSDEDLARPHHWDVGQIANFMYFFGTISSLADYAMFASLLFIFHAAPEVFQSAWFFGSMLTEIIVIFLLRSTHILKTPPSRALCLAALFATWLTFLLIRTPVGAFVDLTILPWKVIGTLLLIVAGYAGLTLIGKTAYGRFRKRLA